MQDPYFFLATAGHVTSWKQNSGFLVIVWIFLQTSYGFSEEDHSETKQIGYRAPSPGVLKACVESKPKVVGSEVPPHYSLREQGLLPRAGDQGENRNSCVAWTLSYYLTSQIRAKRLLPQWGDFDRETAAISASFLYKYALMVDYKVSVEENPVESANNCTPLENIPDENSTIAFESAFRAIGCFGVCRESTFSGILEKVTSAAAKEANAFRESVRSKFGQNFPFSTVDIANQDGLERMRQLLAMNVPLPAGFNVDDAFLARGRKFDNNVWNHYENLNNLKKHAMLIVGYDENLGFLVINSCGPAWGDDGYVYIDFEFFKKAVDFVWKLGIENSQADTRSDSFWNNKRSKANLEALRKDVLSGKATAFCKIARRLDKSESIIERNIVSAEDRIGLSPYGRYRGENVMLGADVKWLNLRAGPPVRTSKGIIFPPEIDSLKCGQIVKIEDITAYTINPVGVKGTVTEYWAEVRLVRGR